MIKKEKIKYLIMILVSLIGLMFMYYFGIFHNTKKSDTSENSLNQIVKKEDSVSIKEINTSKNIKKDFSENSQNINLINIVFIVDNKSYDTKIKNGSNVLDLMNKIKSENNDFDFSGREHSGLGFFVEKINDKNNTNFSYWIYYINDRQAEVGVSSYVLQDGDIINWRLE